MPTISGPFDVTMQGEPPLDERDGISLGRARFDKKFHGALEATSVVFMTSARTTIPNSAAYVAIERIEGTVEGRRGSFCVTHLATMNRGAESLLISVVPDSGTGELIGLSGQMKIRIVERKHFYDFEYALPAQ
ncbi:MAG: DUF3224 domain-containing protein [Myxococcaceae bacterium]